jgi:hypothetical protein
MNFFGVGPLEVALVTIVTVAFWPDRTQATVGQLVRAISRMVRL